MNADERRDILKTPIILLPAVMYRTGNLFALETLIMVLSAFIGVHRRQIAVIDLEMNSRIAFAA